MQLLETSLDNLVYRLGLTGSRSLARQLVTHGNVLVDGKKIDVPSYSVKPGQVVSVSPRGAKINFVIEALKVENFTLPGWLSRKDIIGKPQLVRFVFSNQHLDLINNMVRRTTSVRIAKHGAAAPCACERTASRTNE